MILMFSELYKKDNQMITPDPEVIRQISEKMKLEAESPRKPALLRTRSYQLAGAAAGIFIVLGAALFLPRMLMGNESLSPLNSADKADFVAESTLAGEVLADGDAAGGEVFDDFSANAAADEVLRETEPASDVETEPAPTSTAGTPETAPIDAGGGSAAKAETPENEEAVAADEADYSSNEMADDVADAADLAVSDAAPPVEDWAGYQNFSSASAWPDYALWNELELSEEPPQFDLPSAWGDEAGSWTDGAAGDFDGGAEAENDVIIADAPEDDPQDDSAWNPEWNTEQDDFDEYEDGGDSGAAAWAVKPLGEYTSFGEFAEDYLNAEHRITGIGYSPDGVTVGFSNAMYLDLLPVYALLGSLLEAKATEPDPSYGYAIDISIVADVYININITDTDLLRLTVGSQSGTLYFALPEGTYNRAWHYADSLG